MKEKLNKVIKELSDQGEELGNLRVATAGMSEELIGDELTEVYEDFKFDMVIVDSFILLEEDNQKEFLDLKDNLNGRGFLAVVTCQIPKYEEERLLKGVHQDITRDKYLKDQAGIIITLVQDEDMRENQKIKIFKDVNGDIEEILYNTDYKNVSFDK